MANQPVIYGIRHLSPAGAWYLGELFCQVNPRLVLIEGPSDLTDLMEHMVNPEVKLPVAIMAYTKELPVRTILYPFAEYSPEYQAIRWAYEHQIECRFIDLPSGVFLAMSALRENSDQDTEGNAFIYQKLDEITGEDGHETFWERVMEHAGDLVSYAEGAENFGKELRSLSKNSGSEEIENVIRESYMKRQIQAAIDEGYRPEEIVVVTGAYHTEGLLREALPMTDEELSKLPVLDCARTLMPYSYYRLSSRSGYGAGNRAPAYYELLWKGLCKEDLSHTAYCYLTHIASYQREYGNMVSSAEVIEAVRLSAALAQLNGYAIPALRDLRDAAVTCMGHGRFSEIALAAAETEIGTKIGSLPEGVSQTSIQMDFYRLLEQLKLTKYKSVTAEELHLDLREKLTVKSERAAFLDLERSFFLHRLRILGISFAVEQRISQEKATWAEHWVLRWTPEAEIQIVEAVLKGDTLAQAVSFQLKEQVETGKGIGEIAEAIEEAFLCGMPESASYALAAMQRMATDAVSAAEIARTAKKLSLAVRYGSIRKLDSQPLLPVLEQLFLRGCLVLPGECVCDDNAAGQIAEAIEELNEVVLNHDFLDEERWLQVLKEISGRDDLNTRLSGFVMAILLERGKADNQQLGIEVQRRLSKGVPADLGAGWFEGLSMKNRYALIARMSLWENLCDYLDTLDDEEFKRALVFLRRAFADFSAAEKNDIAENLGEIWKINPEQISETLNAPLTKEAEELLDSLEDFDFDF